MGRKVLIVDDSPIIHIMLKKTLTKFGYTVCGDASNGREGVEMFKSCSPDIIFMDITMPIMDGLEAVKNIRRLDKNIRIIMLSAMGDEDIIRQAKESGVTIFLKKPFDDYKIISAISMME